MQNGHGGVGESLTAGCEGATDQTRHRPLPPSLEARLNEQATGMPCRCGGGTMVVDSRMNVSGAIRRRRVCKVCHARFTTYEQSEEAIRGHLPRSSRPQLQVLRQEVQGILDRIIRMEAENIPGSTP